jgi:hypothetical protein
MDEVLMRLLGVALAAWLAMAGLALADGATLRRAIADAADAFLRAAPTLGTSVAGVDVARYGTALVDGTLAGTPIEYVFSGADDPGCSRFAAYVVPIGQQRGVHLCPRFFSPGADGLRRLTILHELVHVVSDTNECRAMAFAAAVEQAALGRFTPVEAYWQRNGCAASAFSLPR